MVEKPPPAYVEKPPEWLFLYAHPGLGHPTHYRQGPEAQGEVRHCARAQRGRQLEVPIGTHAQDRMARWPTLPDKWSRLEGQMGGGLSA